MILYNKSSSTFIYNPIYSPRRWKKDSYHVCIDLNGPVQTVYGLCGENDRQLTEP